jgi:hypothetical protein
VFHRAAPFKAETYRAIFEATGFPGYKEAIISKKFEALDPKRYKKGAPWSA